MKVTGTYTAVFIWDSSVRNLTIEDSTMSGARYIGIRYEQPATNILLRNIVTTASGQRGFSSSAGCQPARHHLRQHQLRPIAGRPGRPAADSGATTFPTTGTDRAVDQRSCRRHAQRGHA